MKKFTVNAERIAEAVRSIKTEATVELMHVTKNNGVILTAITIRENSSVAPTIYIDDYLNEHKGKRIADDVLQQIAQDIINTYNNSTLGNENDVIDSITSYGVAKKNLYWTLVNKENNKTLERECVTYPFLDMLLVPRIKVGVGSNGIASTKITKKLLQSYGVSADQLYNDTMEVANINMPFTLKGMTEVIRELMSHDGMPQEMLDEICPKEERLYVLSNTEKINGASCLAYYPIKNFAKDMGKDIVILPSSIHEVLFAPITEDMNKDDLTSMVREINETQVSEEERLSNNVYIYRLETDEIEIVE